jgi:predicted permease
MSAARRFLRGLHALIRKPHADADLDAELREFLQTSADEHMRRGLSREDALRASAAEMGSVEAVKDYTRDAGWESGLENLWRDAAYAVRGFRRAPGFAVAVVATLALGIGGTTAIFSVVDALFLRAPDGVRNPQAVRKIFLKRDTGSITTGSGGPGSWVDYATLRDHVPAFAGVAAEQGAALADLGRGPTAEQIRANVVSHEYLDVLGVRPALGRFFLPAEDGPQGRTPVAVISYGMWQSRYGGAADILGRAILLNGAPLDIVGVTERGFTGISSDVVDVWVPSSVPGESPLSGDDWRTSYGSAFAHYVGRLAPGVTDATAIAQGATALQQEAKAQAQAHDRMDPTPEVVTSAITLAAGPYLSKAGNLSLWLVVVSGLMLVVACANVANLLTARGMSRRREVAVRVAIGAGHWRVIRQQLTESLLLALAGGLAGVVLARLGVLLLREFPVPPSAGRIDGRLLAFATTVSVVSGIVFGLLPAVQALRTDPVEELKSSRMIAGPGRHWTRSALVALQLSLSVVLLVGAGLFVGSVRQVTRIHAGVEVDRSLVARVELKRTPNVGIEMREFFDLALSRLGRLPDVEGASIVQYEPFNGTSIAALWKVAGRRDKRGQETQASMLNAAGPGYFRVAGTRLLRGREFGPQDAGGDPVAIVNDATARAMVDSGDAVGMCVPFRRQIRAGGCTRIVGVVENQRHYFLEADQPGMVFFSWAQAPDAPFGTPALLIRTKGAPAASTLAVRNALQGLRPDLPYVAVKPLAENIRDQVMPFQLGATLFTVFAVLALAVSGIGLYGVLGYFVTERTPEIGVRRSLGASVWLVVRMIGRQSLPPVGVGLVTGLAIAFAGSRYLASMLFGVEPHDVFSYGAAAVFLLLTALIATIIPARRAARVDPMVALRHE